MKKWYYSAESHHFSGFLYAEKNADFDRALYCFGPFDTFAEAKRDAIDYFMLDVNEARRCIQEIRAVKEKDVQVCEDEKIAGLDEWEVI